MALYHTMALYHIIGPLYKIPGPGSQTKSSYIRMSLETNSADEIRAN